VFLRRQDELAGVRVETKTIWVLLTGPGTTSTQLQQDWRQQEEEEEEEEDEAQRQTPVSGSSSDPVQSRSGALTAIRP
jgi:hypothetical protein